MTKLVAQLGREEGKALCKYKVMRGEYKIRKDLMATERPLDKGITKQSIFRWFFLTLFRISDYSKTVTKTKA